MWINPETQETYIGHSVIRAAFPNISFPADMTESDIAFAGLEPVQPTEPPAHDPATHQAVPAAPVLQGGVWLQQWAVEDKPPQPVPPAVTMRQARLALLGAGLLAGVDAAIDSLPSPQKEAARIEWEYATEVQRSSGLVPMMRVALGLDDAALDALFIGAAAL